MDNSVNKEDNPLSPHVPDHRPWFSYWPEEVPRHIDYPEIPLQQFLTHTARSRPHNPALRFGEKTMTYQELDCASDRLATVLQAMGVKKGDRIMIVLPNVPEFVIACFGILKAGAVMTAASPLCRERELVGGKVHAREMVLIKNKGLIRDRTYAVRLYESRTLAELLRGTAFVNVAVHTDFSPHRYKGDYGFMNRRMIGVGQKIS